MWLQIPRGKEGRHRARCCIWEWTEKVAGRRHSKSNSG